MNYASVPSGRHIEREVWFDAWSDPSSHVWTIFGVSRSADTSVGILCLETPQTNRNRRQTETDESRRTRGGRLGGIKLIYVPDSSSLTHTHTHTHTHKYKHTPASVCLWVELCVVNMSVVFGHGHTEVDLNDVKPEWLRLKQLELTVIAFYVIVLNLSR